MIPYFRLHAHAGELEAISAVQQKGHWAVGEYISEAEKELRKLFHNKEVVLSSNGYSALFIAIKALGIKGQKIITPCLSTCFAIGNAIVASGNTAVFCDVNLQDGNCDLEHVSALVKEQHIKYIISPNYAGNISDTRYLKKELGLVVIEDACQSFFSSLNYSSEADIQVLSFYPTKGINGIDGGAVVTSSKELAEKARSFVYYNDQTHFEENERYNFRMLNMNAAVLLSNLKRTGSIIEKLQTVKNKYSSSLTSKTEVTVLENDRSKLPHRYVVVFKKESSREKALEVFKKNDISLSLFYEWVCPAEFKKEFKNANVLIKSAFCVPFFEDLSDEEINRIVKNMSDAFA
ncbi:hypothetical protein CNR22_07050 [Sphingobacteriaceae bacterium]|nr:hypothetical protein CNR22_07050 [Sphingobacteriaceae bacterium]